MSTVRPPAAPVTDEWEDAEWEDVDAGAPASAPSDRFGSSIGAGPKLAPEPSTIPESLDRLLERIGLGFTGRNPTSRTLEEEPLNESDFAGVGRGMLNTAMTAAAPAGGPAIAAMGMKALPTLGFGLAGAYGGEAGGRYLGEQVGLPESGAVLGEGLGGLAGGAFGKDGVPLMAERLSPSPQILGAAKGAFMGTPVVGSVTRGAIKGWQNAGRQNPKKAIEALEAIAAAHRVNSGVTPAVEAAEINAIKPSATSSTASFEMKPPPVKAKAAVDASNPTTAKVEAIKATPPVTGAKPASAEPAKPARPAPTVSMEEAIERLKNSPDGATRGKVLRDLLKAGHDKSGVGQAFSGATNSPLDPEDLATAKEILKQAGSFEKAASALDTLEHTPAEKRSLLRALREADRAK